MRTRCHKNTEIYLNCMYTVSLNRNSFQVLIDRQSEPGVTVFVFFVWVFFFFFLKARKMKSSNFLHITLEFFVKFLRVN